MPLSKYTISGSPAVCQGQCSPTWLPNNVNVQPTNLFTQICLRFPPPVQSCLRSSCQSPPPHPAIYASLPGISLGVGRPPSPQPCQAGNRACRDSEMDNRFSQQIFAIWTIESSQEASDNAVILLANLGQTHGRLWVVSGPLWMDITAEMENDSLNNERIQRGIIYGYCQ